MKILVLGASGMAGHVVYQWLSERGYDVVAHARSGELLRRWLILRRQRRAEGAADRIIYTQDLYSDHDALERMITQERPQFVVNCTGILVKESKGHPHFAAYINAYLPHYLEYLGPTYDFATIHISTDCVFSGDAGDYREDSIKDEMAPYGLSKSLGELDNNRDCTIRTSIVGPELKPHGSGLLTWFLRQTDPIRGYANAWWNGVTTLELAKFIEKAIEDKLTGLTHLCASESMCKCDLLEAFAQIYQHKIQIDTFVLKDSVDKTLIMNRDDIEYERREIPAMLEELRSWYE